MAGFALRSFCKKCGHLKRTMPFNDEDWFTGDGGPCESCGDWDSGRKVTAKEVNVGKRYRPNYVWVDKDGNLANPATDKNGEGE